MVYGFILDSIRDSVTVGYGHNKWKRVMKELNLSSETFDIFTLCDDKLLMQICECLVDILHEGTVNTYLAYFGEDFFRYSITLGYHKIFRVAGRTFREFLLTIDQLHDSNRYSFPAMRQPLFHVTDENETGAILEYKSSRFCLTPFAVGTLLGAAKTLYHENKIRVVVRDDLSTPTYTHVVIRIDFANTTYENNSIKKFSALPNLTGPTLFKVFPFSILMDSSLCILQMGANTRKLFSADTPLIGRPLDEVFRLIRPNIHVEWNKVLSYGRHIVFLMENRLPLRVGASGQIRLKGQMKYLQSQNMLWFLCHPVLGSTAEMISAGLHVTDLNLFDGTGEYLVANVQELREMEQTIEKQKVDTNRLNQLETELNRYRKRNQNLLNVILPKHISTMIRSGVTAYGLFETYSSVTILFASLLDFRSATAILKPSQIVGLLNAMLNIFDDITDKFDVFKIKTKMDASFMIVAGLQDRSKIPSEKADSSTLFSLFSRKMNDNEEISVPESPTETIARLSLELLQASELLINPLTRKSFGMRIGFHVGAAVGGIVGDQNFQYCLFGDTVQTARLLMSTGESAKIHVSHAVYLQLIQNNRFTMEYRGQTNMKNKNTIKTYWLIGLSWTQTSCNVKKTAEALQCPINGSVK